METAAEEIETNVRGYIKEASAAYMDNSIVMLHYSQLRYNVSNESSHIGDACIWLVNGQGYIWIESPEIPRSVRAQYVSGDDYRMRLPDEAMSDLDAMSDGETTLSGSFYGLFDHGDINQGTSNWMTVVRKATVSTGASEYTSYVIVSTPADSVSIDTIPMIRIYMLPFIIAIIICFVVATLISRPMTRQISGLSKAARKVSAGEFDVQLPKASNDEMGLLVRNFGQMTENLANLEKMRSEFVSNVSHELRTPMTSILGFITAIQDGTVPEEQRDYYLNIIREETERLQKLTNDLLELTRIESGQIQVNMTAVDINDLCQKCVVSMAPLFEEKEIRAVLDLEDRALYARCDGSMIQRVIVNIVHNAIKFTPAGGEIRVSARGDGTKVTVSVADSGPGLSDEDLARIWDRFYKGDKSRGIDAKGSGLGMSIAWNIIREHGETISASNGPEGGAVFSFTLREEMIV
jgi:signal transduction histidine kinase